MGYKSIEFTMFRLNPGIGDRHNFFLIVIFLFKRIGSDLVNHTDSGDIKVFVQLPENSILKCMLDF